MHDNADSRPPKKLRQLSITESFGSVVRKRKPPSMTAQSSLQFANNIDSQVSNSAHDESLACNKRSKDTPAEMPSETSVTCLLDTHEVAAASSISDGEISDSMVDCQNTSTKRSCDHSGDNGALDRFSESNQEQHDITMGDKKEAEQVSATMSQQEQLLQDDSLDIMDTCLSSVFDTDFEEKDSSSSKWMGMPKSRLKTAPDCLLPLPELQAADNHSVFFDTSYLDFGPPPPNKSAYVDAWDSNHVKLPCSPKSLFPTPGKERCLTSRWELIENALLCDIRSSRQLEKAINQYNVRFNQPFVTLHILLNEYYGPMESGNFFSNTLPQIIKLALSLPTILTQPIPLLKRQRNHCVTLSQKQIACLLANAFLCTFPRRNSTSPNAEYCSYPSINFNRLLTGTLSEKRSDSCVEKLKTLLHYFKRVCDEMPSGVVSFERKVCHNFPVWNKSPSEICGLHICSEGLIEDGGKGMLQMDFANKYVGGGVLGQGLVQEEILFCIFPELIASRLFTEVMDCNECLYITGAERFSKYSGYASEYRWEGNYVDSNTRDLWRRKVSHFVALDAMSFRRSADQYKVGNIRRELNKLYCGFQGSPDHSPAIATGNWGCGAFGGNPVFKALLQMMAAATVCRDLCYFTFKDSELMKTIHDMHEYIKSSNLNVGDLWKLICQYNEQEIMVAFEQNRPVVENIVEFIRRIRRDYEVSTDEE